MSMFTKDEQTKIVKQAMELETAIQNGQSELSRLKREKFKDAPDKPIKKVAQPVEPDYSALPQVDFSYAEFLKDDIKTKPTLLNKLFSAHPIRRGLIISVVGCLVCLVLTIFVPIAMNMAIIPMSAPYIAVIYWFVKRSAYKKKKKEISESPAYIQGKAEADRIAQQKQAAIDADLRNQYEQEKAHYDTVILPRYKEELSAWTAEQNKRIQAAADKLEAARRVQSELYETSRIIPMQYRDIEALTYIYQLMSTSDYDIKEAVNMYDKELQRQQEAARIEEQQRANALAEEQNYHLRQQNALAVEQNDLLAEQNDLEKKAQKQQRIADGVTFVQNHNRNKYLKNRR